MSGTTTVSKTEEEPPLEEERALPRRSRRLGGLTVPIQLTNLNLPIPDPTNRGRGREKKPQTSQSKVVRFARSFRRSTSAGSEGKPTQGGSVSDPEGYGGARAKSRSKSPAVTSSEGTPRSTRSPSPTRRSLANLLEGSRALPDDEYLKERLNQLRTTTRSEPPPRPKPPVGVTNQRLNHTQELFPQTNFLNSQKAENWGEFVQEGAVGGVTSPTFNSQIQTGAPPPYTEDRPQPVVAQPGTIKKETTQTNRATPVQEAVVYNQGSGRATQPSEVQGGYRGALQALEEMPEYPGKMDLATGKVNLKNPLDESLTEAVASQLHKISLEAKRTEGAKRAELLSAALSVQREMAKQKEENFQDFSESLQNRGPTQQSTPEKVAGDPDPINENASLDDLVDLMDHTQFRTVTERLNLTSGSRDATGSFHTAVGERGFREPEQSEAVRVLSGYLTSLIEQRGQRSGQTKEPSGRTKTDDRILNIQEARFEKPTTCLRCPQLAMGPKGLCRDCLEKEQRSGSYLNDNQSMGDRRSDSAMDSLRRDILNDRARNNASLTTLSVQRSTILLKEIKFFSMALRLMGGGETPQLVMENQKALHNLRNPSEGGPEGTPIVQKLGLRRAIQLVDQVTQVSEVKWVVYLHREILEGRIKGRPLDPHSWHLFKDEHIQSWFDRLSVLDKAFQDPAFMSWVDGSQTQIGKFFIKRFPDIASRVAEIRECITTMGELYQAFITQPGIRGPAHQWVGPTGLFPPENPDPKQNIGPAFFWNMRMLEDSCFIKSSTGRDTTADAQALFNLREILYSLMDAISAIADILRDPRNRDIRHFLNYRMMEVDESVNNPPVDPHWESFNQAVTPWISDNSWATVTTQIDLWQDELRRTEEFQCARNIEKDKSLLSSKLGQSTFATRGVLGQDAVYKRSVSPGPTTIPKTHNNPYANIMKKALTPFKGSQQKTRQEAWQAYIQGEEEEVGGRGTRGWNHDRTPGQNPSPPGGGPPGGPGTPGQGGGGGGAAGGGGPPNGPPPPGGGGGGDPGGGGGRGRKYCTTCKQYGHEAGDPLCPGQEDKLCFICHSTSHNQENCFLRRGAPPCEWCLKDPHEKLEDCPRYQQELQIRKAEAFKQIPFGGGDETEYARWHARVRCGADLDGRYPPRPDLAPLSEIGNELRRIRREEDQRLREEMRITEEILEKRKHELARAAIEAHEAERAIEGRYLAELKDGEELTARQKENIIKQGDVVFNQYQSQSRGSTGVMKDSTLEELDFGAEVVFRGDTLGTNIKDFISLFDEVKYHKGMDDYKAARLIGQRLKGQARIWFDHFKGDPTTRDKARSYPELRSALLKRFQRKRDWIDRNRLFKKVRWGPRYKGSHLSVWEDCKTTALEFLKDWDEEKQFTPAEVRVFLASQHFFNMARNGMVMHLMEKGVEDDPAAMEREIQKKEIIIEYQHRQQRAQLQDDDHVAKGGYRVHAIEEDGGRSVLERYWDDHDPTDDSIEVEALRKRDGDGSGEGEEAKVCWNCKRPGHVKANCPELQTSNRERPGKLPGDDGKFRGQDVPGFESEAVKKNWTGPPRAQTKATAAVRNSKGRYTKINRSKGSRKPTRIRNNRSYKSRRTSNTYRVAALGSSFLGHDDESIGHLERVLVAGDVGEDVDVEDEDDLQPIYAPTEVAELSKPQEIEADTEAPEVAGLDHAPAISLSQTEKGYFFETRGDGDTGERYVPFRY